MDEEVAALTGDLPEPPGKAAKTSKPVRRKASKSSAEPKAKPQSAAGGFGKGLIVGLLILVLVVGGALPVLYFNVGGLATRAIGLLQLDKQLADIQQERTYELDRRTSEIDDREAELEEGKRTLARELDALDKRELEVSERETALAQQDAKVSGEAADIQGVIAIYEAMDPAQAAAVLSALDDDKMLVVILKNMTQSRVSQIMGKLDAGTAAKMLSLLASGTVDGQDA